MSNNLDLEQMTEGQASKEVTVNNKGAEIDAALTEQISLDLSSGNVTVSNANYRRAIQLLWSGVATSGRTVTLPAIKRLISIRNPLTSSDSVEIIKGTSSYDLEPGETVMVYTDGTANGADFMPMQPAGNIPYDLPFFFPGMPTPGALMARFIAIRPFTLPQDLPGSQFYSGTDPADADQDITIKKNNASTIGTLTFIGTVGGGVSVTFSSDVSFVAGDRLELIAPDPQDSAWSDISVSIAARR